jgi:excisionase family DNA binding protein
MNLTPSEIDSLAHALAECLVPKLTSRLCEDSYLNIHSAAELLGCSVPTVERRTREGKIPSIKIGRLRRYRRGDLLSLRHKKKGGCDE